MMQKSEVGNTPSLLVKDTYLALIQNSVGSKMFRNIYVKVGNKKKDITEQGNLSCAYYVSSVLVLLKLLTKVHATVRGTVEDMRQSDWKEIKKPKIGAVLVWAQTDFGAGGTHGHIGFFIGNNQAISNDYKKGYPRKHDFQFGGKRKIEHIFWHTALE